MINKYELKNITSYLCIGVSKSGYHNYLSNENKRIEKDKKDQGKLKWF